MEYRAEGRKAGLNTAGCTYGEVSCGKEENYVVREGKTAASAGDVSVKENQKMFP